MNAQDKTTGGFAGDPAEAFAPAAGTGCCGSPAGHTDIPKEAGGAAAPCCGTSEQAEAEGSCCGQAAKAEAVALASGAGCCG